MGLFGKIVDPSVIELRKQSHCPGLAASGSGTFAAWPNSAQSRASCPASCGERPVPGSDRKWKTTASRRGRTAGLWLVGQRRFFRNGNFGQSTRRCVKSCTDVIVVPFCAAIEILLPLRKSEVGTAASTGAKNSVNSLALQCKSMRAVWHHHVTTVGTISLV
jgi:hypothetical protein